MKVHWFGKMPWAFGAWALLWACSPAQSQDLLPPINSGVNERLEKLEKQNEALSKQNEQLQQSLQNLLKAQETPVSTGVGRDEVQKIVSDYMKAQTEKGKAEKKGDGWYEVGSDTGLKAYYGGSRLTFESANKDFRAHLGGRIQYDSYLFGQNTAFRKNAAVQPLDDAEFFRRIRVEFYGQAFEQIEWSFEVDLEANQVGVGSSSTASAFDELWAGLKDLPVIGNARIGHVRVPQGLENYTSSRNLMFLERSTGQDGFLQEFDPGLWMFNSYMDQRLGWAFTFHRVEPDSDAIIVGKGNYAGTGKIYGLPYYANNGRGLFHVGASYQYASNAFNSAVKDRTVLYRARPDFRVDGLTPRFVNTGAIISDHETTFGLEALLIWGPFSVQAEWFNVYVADPTYPSTKGVSVASPNFNSAYLAASVFLTGENRAYDKRLGRIDRLTPNENFFLVRGEEGGLMGGLGAWELCARYDMIDLNDGAIQGGYMNNYTLGLNWYLNRFFKVQWNWNVADRNVLPVNVGGAAAGPSGLVHSVGMRVQCEF